MSMSHHLSRSHLARAANLGLSIPCIMSSGFRFRIPEAFPADPWGTRRDRQTLGSSQEGRLRFASSGSTFITANRGWNSCHPVWKPS